jgi:site-specific DNA-methyltransferase (adenine-specific)
VSRLPRASGVYPPAVLGALEVLEGNTQFCVCQCNALELLGALPPESIDAVVTDPPYSSGGAFRGDRAARTGTKYIANGAHVAGPDFAGDSRDQLSQLAWCTLWLSQALRAAKDGAPIVMWSDWRQIGLSITALQCGGWIFRGIVPWTKKGAGRPQRGRFRSDAEFAVWGSKGPMPLDRAVGGPSRALLGHVQAAPIVAAKRRHQTEKPVEVMRELVRICEPGGVVLDPFTGGGSTGVAAIREGYRFIGGELVETYVERSSRAIAAVA